MSIICKLIGHKFVMKITTLEENKGIVAIFCERCSEMPSSKSIKKFKKAIEGRG